MTPEQTRAALENAFEYADWVTDSDKASDLRRVERLIAEARADALEQAADHLDVARMSTWNGGTRRINGWSSAAYEIRALARKTRGEQL